MTELFPDEILTDRLRLVKESVAEADLGERYAAMNEDAVADGELAYVPLEPFAHLKDAREYVASREDRMQSGDAGTYVVRPRECEERASEASRAADGRAGKARETGAPAGEAELFVVWERRSAFMNFGLRKRFWGRGYSGERAAAFVRLAFERLDLEVVLVSHIVANENSQRAIEKYVDRFGGRREARLRNQYVMDDEPHDVVQYSISREEYEESGDRPDVEFFEDRDDRRESR
jgi:RimJ/RimL family protein N-acetyltransferase